MNWKDEWKKLTVIIAVFLLLFYLPVDSTRVSHAVMESLYLAQWYAREHVLLCLVPAFFIAGAIEVFINQASVLKYLGARANRVLAYAVASVSGSTLAVCSCTVLPIFAGIYRMGAGLGPATAFLYSGPAINIFAIVLTARVLGMQLGIARAVGAIGFSVVIGILMQLIFHKQEKERIDAQELASVEDVKRPLWQNAVYFASMIGILVFANWGEPSTGTGIWAAVYSVKWLLVSVCAAGLGVMLIFWFEFVWWKIAAIAFIVAVTAAVVPDRPLITFTVGVVALSVVTGSGKGEAGEWFASSWGFARQILPLLFAGVLIAGALLGRVGHEGLIPSGWITEAVGGNSLRANFLASFAGALMYFATLTEVPVLQALLGNGMGKGPALALLLAGPALSLPNMLVIRSVLGTTKTLVFVGLVIVMATISGMIFGNYFGG